jgi:hypothetical protein
MDYNYRLKVEKKSIVIFHQRCPGLGNYPVTDIEKKLNDFMKKFEITETTEFEILVAILNSNR